MPFYVVSYDLRKKDEFDYETLWDDLADRDAVKVQESVYLLKSDLSRKDVKEHFASLMHEDDYLLVVEFEKRPSWTKALKGTRLWVDAHWT